MVRIDDSGDDTKCWLRYPDEIEQLAEAARDDDWEREIAILLLGKVGLRASGVPTAQPEGIRFNEEGDYWELKVKGKNTRTGSKATRYAYVPEGVKKALDRFATERDISPSDSYVPVSVPSIRRWVHEAREKLVDEQEEWQYVSSHDLRRSWANHHLSEKDVPVRVMMEIGGWSRYESIEPYLTKPTPEKIGREMNAVQ